ncbi:hypothetical protein [Streptomyces sp. IGB124]|uniref:hypothetical protein n=1 Tax=Streptomyces sp. IGB124 TaxID=1519485 RepID=UPI000B3119CF|nr:hypothetical protein [Streptomyces sp. IGB124]
MGPDAHARRRPEEGTALAAARLLGREQSSVQKQLDILNRNFQALTGELVVVKQGRGRDLLFTPTGLEVVDRIRSSSRTGSRASQTPAAGSAPP